MRDKDKERDRERDKERDRQMERLRQLEKKFEKQLELQRQKSKEKLKEKTTEKEKEKDKMKQTDKPKVNLRPSSRIKREAEEIPEPMEPVESRTLESQTVATRVPKIRAEQIDHKKKEE